MLQKDDFALNQHLREGAGANLSWEAVLSTLEIIITATNCCVANTDQIRPKQFDEEHHLANDRDHSNHSCSLRPSNILDSGLIQELGCNHEDYIFVVMLGCISFRLAYSAKSHQIREHKPLGEETDGA